MGLLLIWLNYKQVDLLFAYSSWILKYLDLNVKYMSRSKADSEESNNT